MRAALIEAFGEPTEVLELVDVPEPAGPAAGEVLVGVEYAPINMNDLYVIQGAFPVRPSLPSVVGNEGGVWFRPAGGYVLAWRLCRAQDLSIRLIRTRRSARVEKRLCPCSRDRRVGVR
jgi:hypothetical protein